MENPKLIKFQHIENCGASLNVAESNYLPFKVERVFWVSDAKKGAIRGEHAHKTSEQIVVAMVGKIEIDLEGVDGSRYSYRLNNPKQGVYIPPLFWGKITFDVNTVLLTLASDEYNESDYIRNYKEFLMLKQE